VIPPPARSDGPRPEELCPNPGCLTGEQKDRLLSLLRSGVGVAWAVDRIGATGKAVRAERRHDPVFNARFRSAREISTDVCLLKLYEQVIGDRFDAQAAVAFVRLREEIADRRLARKVRWVELRIRARVLAGMSRTGNGDGRNGRVNQASPEA
jgi:hypothetical protein